MGRKKAMNLLEKAGELNADLNRAARELLAEAYKVDDDDLASDTLMLMGELTETMQYLDAALSAFEGRVPVPVWSMEYRDLHDDGEAE